MARKGMIFVISSPSGGGKTTICNALKKEHLNLVYSVSMTTRKPRRNERGGRDYAFVNKEEFRRLAQRNNFLEWTNNFGALYGTPKRFVLEALSKGKDVVLSIDVKGAMQVRRLYKTAVLIFLLPPSLRLLKKRLRMRRTEDKEGYKRRLKAAKRELAYSDRYDYAVQNDKLAKAVGALKSIIITEREKVRD